MSKLRGLGDRTQRRRIRRGNNKNYQGIQPRLDSIVGPGVGLNVSLSSERCRGGGTIGEMVRSKRGAQGRFKTSVDLSIGQVHLKLQLEWKVVSMYLHISLSLGKGFFSFPLSLLVKAVEAAE